MTDTQPRRPRFARTGFGVRTVQPDPDDKRPTIRKPPLGGDKAQAQAAHGEDHPHHPARVMGDIAQALDQLGPKVLSVRTYILDNNGTAADQSRVPYRSMFIDSNSGHLLTLANSTLQSETPTSGPGIAFVRPGGSRTVNFRGYAWSVYGGAAGELVTVTTFTTAQHENSTGAAIGQNGPTLQATSAGGGITSPGAGATIVTLTGLPAGLYSVQWTLSLGGTTGAGDANNTELVVVPAAGATVIEAVSNNRTSAGAAYPQIPVNIQVPAGAAVSILAIAAGTVGVVYDGSLVLTLLR